jgi:hypothetical protein
MTNPETTEMRLDPARVRALVSQLRGVNDKIAAVSKGRNVRRAPSISILTFKLTS